MWAWLLTLNLKPRTTQISPKHTDFNSFLHILIIVTRTMTAWRGCSERMYAHFSLCDCTWQRTCLPSLWLQTNLCLHFQQGNDCLPAVLLITLWAFFCLCACLAGSAPEGDQHADPSLCLPQQPVDRQRQQQPHHTNPRVVYLHAVCQQVCAERDAVRPHVWLHWLFHFLFLNPTRTSGTPDGSSEGLFNTVGAAITCWSSYCS